VSYPLVLNEKQTVARLATGMSISRFGDGELKIMCGSGYAREEPNRALASELISVLRNPAKRLLLGIPTLDPVGPKYRNWCAHRERFERVLPARSDYASAFITRPDSAPWINNRAYAESVQALWADKRVALVAEATTKFVRLASIAAREVKHIECPRHGAYSKIDLLQAEVEDLEPEVALLSCGPTATCLANRLCRKGIHSIDIGSAGGFLSRLLLS